MSFDKNDVEMALDMIKRGYLIDLAEERGVADQVDDKRKKNELKEVLLAEDWDDPEFETLLDAVEDYKKETDPLGYYVGVIEEVNGEEEYTEDEIIELLSADEASFDKNDELTEEGFTIETEGGAVSGIYWTKNTSYHLNPRREVYTRETLYDTSFRFDLDNDVIYIGAGLPTKADQLVNILGNFGISIREVGSHGLFIHPDSANDIFKNFVNDLKQQTNETISQATIDDVESGGSVSQESIPTLKIYSVEILAEDESLEEIAIDGKSDIFEDDGVNYFLNNRGGKITSIQGKFDYSEQPFTFEAGYGNEDNLGRLSVKKRGSASIDPKQVDECFDFLSNIYIKHFINFESYDP